jgi:hypothetical protein
MKLKKLSIFGAISQAFDTVRDNLPPYVAKHFVADRI